MNFDHMISSPSGRMAHAQELMEAIESHRSIHEAIAKGGGIRMHKGGAEVGTPTQGQAIASSGFAALIPQDLAPYYYSTIATRAKRVALLSAIKRETALQVVKERVIKKKHGDPWMISSVDEAGIPGVEVSDYEKRINSVRFHSVQRQITHVGQQVHILNAQYPLVRATGPGGLAMEQESGLESLVEKMERDYWNGDSSVDATRVDGVFKQIIAGGTANINYIDLRAATMDIDRVVDALAGVTIDGYEGEPSILWLAAEQWAPLSKEAMDKNRLDPSRGRPRPGELYWNPDIAALLLVGPNGKALELREARLMNNQLDVPTTAGGGLNLTVSAANESAGSPSVAAHASSLFAAGDAGTYSYKIMARFRKGYSIPYTASGIVVAAGDRVTFEYNDSGLATASSGDLVDYVVWRAEVDTTSNYKMVGIFGANDDGPTNSGTIFYDDNARIPGTFRSAALHMEDGALVDVVLVDAAQIPLAQVERRLPFLQCRYSAPHVVMPRKQIVFLNAGVA